MEPAHNVKAVGVYGDIKSYIFLITGARLTSRGRYYLSMWVQYLPMRHDTELCCNKRELWGPTNADTSSVLRVCFGSDIELTRALTQ